ncbi:MAG: DNA methyltransferase [Bryobacteraceae bacterium]|nr:DNA methyltransferase [Bryobacteraceae bacterium]
MCNSTVRIVGDNEDEKKLSAAERTRLKKLERRIERGEKLQIGIGRALREIRDDRLYRETHDRFEDYVHARFGYSRGYAYNLIAAVDAFDNLANVATTAPANEYQVRPLVKLEPEQQKDAWSKAVDAAGVGKVTHELVKAAVNELMGITTPVQFAPADADTEAAALSDYWQGTVADHVGRIAPHSVDLLLITDLPGATPQESAGKLDDLLGTTLALLCENCQALVFCTHLDYRKLLTTAEAHGYEMGVPLIWDKISGPKPTGFSFTNTVEFVLHFRKGSAQLHDPIGNVLYTEQEPGKLHRGQKPVVLLADLISCAVPPGALVLDPTGGVASTVIACRRTHRKCIVIEPNTSSYAVGVERIKKAA